MRTVYEMDRHRERSAVSDVLAAAFQEDPIVGWMFPDPTERPRLQRAYYTALLRQPNAQAYLNATGDAAAIWLDLPAGQAPLEDPQGADAGGPDPLAVFGPHAERLGHLGGLLAQHHPHSEHHLYLACLGVRPDRQGGGLGSALLRHCLTEADAEGLPAYLEASSPRSRDLYLRHGFQDLGTPVQPSGDLLIWPMWRPKTLTS
ncbi:GNAT family N-acetyltransferase [Actinopolymorpha pittospori]|nr:GNAT family N-acetyltransferase [Actinopolymorpha pittospori]